MAMYFINLIFLCILGVTTAKPLICKHHWDKIFCQMCLLFSGSKQEFDFRSIVLGKIICQLLKVITFWSVPFGGSTKVKNDKLYMCFSSK